MSPPINRTPPRRHLDKQEAIRHLIHAAFRLIAAGEDPFAIHLLIQSAEKLLLDVARKRGRTLGFDWEGKVRPEHKTEFFKVWRETYNYFKHADRDSLSELRVHDIAGVNATTLFITIENYRELYGSVTDHMRLYYIFIQCYMPDIFEIPPENVLRHEAALALLHEMTPADLFSMILEHHTLYVPNFDKEKASDISDAFEFYATPFSVHADGK